MASAESEVPQPAPRDTYPAVNQKSRGFVAQVNEGDLHAVQAKQMALIDQMIMWQIHNPGEPWTKCAPVVGKSVTWLRLVASSDAYRARYAAASDKLLSECALPTLRERVAAAAEVVVERLAEKAALSESMGDLTDAAEVLLKVQFGTAAPPAPPAQQQAVVIQNNLILESRNEIVKSKGE